MHVSGTNQPLSKSQMKTIAGLATVAVVFMQIGCHTKARVDNSNETAKPNPAQAIPLLRAHAHNDYEHSRPLFDALAHGFTSIEADFFLVNGHLCVAHDIKEIDTTRTLQSLYLEPLMNLVRQNGGWVFPQPVQLTLLIDLKSEARSSYLALRPVLHEYKKMLTAIAAGERQLGPIITILTGNVAHELVLSDSLRYAEIDGRFEDWRRDFYPPLVSEDWQKLVKWKFPKPRGGVSVNISYPFIFKVLGG